MKKSEKTKNIKLREASSADGEPKGSRPGLVQSAGLNTESTSQGGKNGPFFRKRLKKVNPETELKF